MTPCAFTASVDRHFAGGLDPEAERALRTHLPGCEACRARYDRRLVLERLQPTAPPREDRLARALGLPPRAGARAPRSSAPWLVAAAGLAVAVVLLVVGPRLSPADDGFTPRGGGDASLAPLEIYRLRPGAAPERVQRRIAAGDELAFAYRNPAGKKRLMVYGVDQAGRVYWYFPAWTKPEEDPLAVPIEPSATARELPAAVAQPLQPGALTLHALFTDQPLTVRQVEAALDGGAAPGADTEVVLEVAP